jgi:hypothetical protein
MLSTALLSRSALGFCSVFYKSTLWALQLCSSMPRSAHNIVPKEQVPDLGVHMLLILQACRMQVIRSWQLLLRFQSKPGRPVRGLLKEELPQRYHLGSA